MGTVKHVVENVLFVDMPGIDDKPKKCSGRHGQRHFIGIAMLWWSLNSHTEFQRSWYSSESVSRVVVRHTHVAAALLHFTGVARKPWVVDNEPIEPSWVVGWVGVHSCFY